MAEPTNTIEERKPARTRRAFVVVSSVLITLLAVSTAAFAYESHVRPGQLKQLEQRQVSPNTTASSTPTPSAAVTIIAPRVELPNWNVGFNAYGFGSEGDDQLIVTSVPLDGAEAYSLTTKRITAYGADCSEYAGHLAVISRYLTGSKAEQNTQGSSGPSVIARIGQYSYYYLHPQSICSDAKSDTQMQIFKHDADVLRGALGSLSITK